jgi:hypothetical protein
MPKPKIVQKTGHLEHELADVALEALYETCPPIFQEGPRLIRVCSIDGGPLDDADKSTFGADHDGNQVRFPVVLAVTPTYLGRMFAQRVDWLNKGKKVYPPSNIMAHILNMAGELKFPEFAGIATIPFLLPDYIRIHTQGITLNPY